MVCRKFRRIITRSRALWSNLTVAGDDRLCGKPCVIVDGILESLVRRAGPALRQLAVRGCEDLTSAGLNAVIAQCDQQPGGGSLTTIELSDCAWVGLGDLLDLLTGCRSLLQLAVSGCRGTGPPTAGQQPESGLTHLKVDDARFTAAELHLLLQRCPRLEHLQIFAAPRTAAGQLVEVVTTASLGKLHTLQLGDAASRPGHWTESSSVLMESSFDGGVIGTSSADAGDMDGDGLLGGALATVDDAMVQALLERCQCTAVTVTGSTDRTTTTTSALKVLELSGFRGLHGSALSAIPASVVQLSLRGCSSLQSLGLPVCSNLLALDLEECCALTDSALIHIGRQCPQLLELNVEGCEQLNDAAISASVEAGGFRNLQRLNTRGCPSITSAGLSDWASAGLSQSTTDLADIGHLTYLVLGYDSGSVHSLNLPPTVAATNLSAVPDWFDSSTSTSNNASNTSPVSQASGGADQGLGSTTDEVEAAAAVWRWLAPIDDEGLAELASISPLEVLGTTTIVHMHMHPLRFQRQPGEGCDAMQCNALI
jgi:hypothetical protein